MKSSFITLNAFLCILLYGNSFNFGCFPANEMQKHVFVIKNGTQNMLHLGKIRTNCTCTEAKYNKAELRPGESTSLTVKLKANSIVGRFCHGIYVETDNPKQRFMRFVVSGSAEPLFKISPEPMLYVGCLIPGKVYKYCYDLIPNNYNKRIELALVHQRLPDGVNIKLKKDESKYRILIVIIPRPSTCNNTVCVKFAVKISEPAGWADLNFAIIGKTQSS